MNKYIIANRTDGLGVRLNAMLRAIALSQYLNVEFKFTWDDRSNNTYHDLCAANDMFQGDYLDTYLTTEDYLKTLIKVNPEDIQMFEDDCYAISPQIAPITHLAKIIKDQSLNEYLDSSIYKDIFDNIGFSAKHRKAIADAYSVSLNSEIVAIHLRAGDVIYGPFARSGYYVQKIVPYSVAVEIIKSHSNVLVFAQDQELANHLKNKMGVKLASDYYDETYNGVQKALFDIVLMSRCNKIYAGRSGFSICSSTISDAKIIIPEKLYSDEYVVNLILDDFRKGNLNFHLGIQVAHNIKSALVLSKMSIDNELMLELTKFAKVNDPDNLLYAFLHIIILFKLQRFQCADDLYANFSNNECSYLALVIKLHSKKSILNFSDEQGYLREIEGANKNGSQLAMFISFLFDFYQSKDTTSYDISSIKSYFRGSTLRVILNEIE